MGPVSMSDSFKVNEETLLPQLFKSGLFFRVLCNSEGILFLSGDS